MAKKQQSSSKSQRTGLTGIMGIAVVIVVVAIALATGADPVALLNQLTGGEAATPQATETTEGEAATATPTPSEDDVKGTAVAMAGAGAGGDWWQVYFTEPIDSTDESLYKDGIDQYLQKAIDGAQTSIDVAAFEFNLSTLTEALIEAKGRGVEVRVVTDDEHGIEDEDTTLEDLEDVDIEVVDDSRGALMHNKFVVIDGKQVWTGSWNLTINGTYRNNNNVIAIDSPELAAIYEREFTEMFEGHEFGGRSPTFENPDEQKVVVNGVPIQAYFAPEDDVGDKIAALVEGAKSSVRFMAFSFTHDGIGQALLDRAAAGVTVEGIFEKTGSNTEYSELTNLFCKELPVRQDGNPRVFHHKVFIIDDETVLLGSFNFSKNADESNDENVLIIQDADIAAQYNAEFDRRWQEASDPDTEDIKCN